MISMILAMQGVERSPGLGKTRWAGELCIHIFLLLIVLDLTQ